MVKDIVFVKQLNIFCNLFEVEFIFKVYLRLDRKTYVKIYFDIIYEKFYLILIFFLVGLQTLS